jgi:signal transduction histidine kinase
MKYIFRSHFTTKSKDKGTGIGLFMTKQIIVDNMQGNISVNNISYEYENITHTGAKFTIQIPIITSTNKI